MAHAGRKELVGVKAFGGENGSASLQFEGRFQKSECNADGYYSFGVRTGFLRDRNMVASDPQRAWIEQLTYWVDVYDPLWGRDGGDDYLGGLSDKSTNRSLHVAASCLLGAIGLLIAAAVPGGLLPKLAPGS